MIRVLRTHLRAKTAGSGRQVDPLRARQLRNWHDEPSTLKHGLTPWMKFIKAQAEERRTEQRRKTRAKKSSSQEQELRTDGLPKQSLQHIPWTTATASHRNRACKHARRNGAASGIKTWRHVTCCSRCNPSNNKDSRPHLVIGLRNTCVILCQS